MKSSQIVTRTSVQIKPTPFSNETQEHLVQAHLYILFRHVAKHIL